MRSAIIERFPRHEVYISKLYVEVPNLYYNGDTSMFSCYLVMSVAESRYSS